MMFFVTTETTAFLVIVVIFGVTVVAQRSSISSRLPLVIHNSAWIIALSVVATGWIRYETISLRAWTTLVAGILAYNLGVALVGSGGHPLTVPLERAVLVTRTTLGLLFSGYALGFLVYLATIVGRYGAATLLTDPGKIRAEGIYLAEIPLPAKLLFYLGPLVFILLVNQRLVQRPFAVAIRLGLAGLVLASQAIALQRTNLFVALFWQIAFLVGSPPPQSRAMLAGFGGRFTRSRRSRRVAVVACGVVALFAFQAIGAQLGKDQVVKSVSDNVSPFLRDSAFVSAATYVSAGPIAFGSLVESTDQSWPPLQEQGAVYGDYNPQTWGAATFPWFLKVLPLGRQWEEVAPFTYVPFPTNVYTWLEPFYRDFREPGVVLGAFVLGGLTTRLYCLRRRGPGWALASALVVGLSAWAPFVNKYVSVFFVELLVLIALLSIVRPRSSGEKSGRASSRRIAPAVHPRAHGVGVDWPTESQSKSSERERTRL